MEQHSLPPDVHSEFKQQSTGESNVAGDDNQQQQPGNSQRNSNVQFYHDGAMSFNGNVSNGQNTLNAMVDSPIPPFTIQTTQFNGGKEFMVLSGGNRVANSPVSFIIPYGE